MAPQVMGNYVLHRAPLCVDCAPQQEVSNNMSDAVALPTLGPKVQPFWSPLPAALTEQEISSILSRSVAHARLPDGTDFKIPLAGLFTVTPARQKDQEGVDASPNTEALHKIAYAWCQKLTTLPPKSLPRSQRPVIKLLQRLPEEPTGNPAFDKGRTMILDGTVKGFWVSVTTTMVSYLIAQANQKSPDIGTAS